MWSYVSLALVALMVASASAADTQGWTNVGGRFLKFFAEPKTFSQAKAVCDGVGGLLVFDDHPSVSRYLALTSEYTICIIMLT